MFSINGLSRDRHSLETLPRLVNEGTTESASGAFDTWGRARLSGEKNNSDPVAPLSTYQTNNPEDLWDWMESYQDKTGRRLPANPHNDNMSSGLMFIDLRFIEEHQTSASSYCPNRFSKRTHPGRLIDDPRHYLAMS